MDRATEYPELAADDVDALDALVGGYAFMAAEQTIDEVYAAIGMRATDESRELQKRIGKIASKVSDDLEAYFRERIAEAGQAGTWEVERVVLERMRGNPAARPKAPEA